MSDDMRHAPNCQRPGTTRTQGHSVVIVKCDGCGRAIDPAADPNCGDHPSQDVWSRDNMTTWKGLTVVCYAVKAEDPSFAVTDCCMYCMKDMLQRLVNLL